MIPHDLDNPPPRRKDSHGREEASLDHGSAIDEDLVLAVVSSDHVDLDSKLTADLRRHTGGVEPRDSIGAESDGYSDHAQSLTLRKQYHLAAAL